MNNLKKPEMAKFGERLRDLRQSTQKKQSEMAEVLGCTTSHYQKMEYGEINIPSISLMILADYFGVTTDYLLGRTEER